MTTNEDHISAREELLALAAALKGHLHRWQRQGVWAIPEKGAEAEGCERPAPPPERTAETTTGDDTDVSSDLLSLEASGDEGLGEIENLLGACARCGLSKSRGHIVFGEGDARADVVFVGEAPGGQEDRSGRPFVGPAGQLLTKMIRAMGLDRDRVYIANIIKCRPPRNRDPEKEEMDVCEPFLQAQLRAIEPSIVIALGRVAAQRLLRSSAPLGVLRGELRDYLGYKLMATYHPAYLLRNPKGKRAAWQDLQTVMAEMDRLGLERRR
jgi:DNA polymerase